MGLSAYKGIKYVLFNQEEFFDTDFWFKNYPEWFILFNRTLNLYRPDNRPE